MLLNFLFISWLLSSFLTHADTLEDRLISSALKICNVNGTFLLGNDCPPDSASPLQIMNGSIISHPVIGPSPTSSSIISSSSIVSSTSSIKQASQANPASSARSSSSSISSATSIISHSATENPSPSSSSATSVSKSASQSQAVLTTSSSRSSVKSSATSSSSVPTGTLPPIIGNAPGPKSGPFTLAKLYQGADFINEWDFFNDTDPTHGPVTYVRQEDAVSLGLISVQGNHTIIKVDDTTQLKSGDKRNSVRIQSQMRIQGGLIVANIKAMPTGCSVWPAFWAVGDHWPDNGEIDFVEGVNLQTQNQMSGHTLPGCTRNDHASPAPGQSQPFTGTPLQASCDVTVNSNSGCGVLSTQKNTFGAGFNDNGGGVFAATWNTDGIKIWVFTNGNVPSDIHAMTPTPSTWPAPDAFWDSDTCIVDRYFANLQLVFDTTLCGDFAGTLFPSSGCPGTCADTVADPANYQNAKWEIEYVALYN